MKKDENLGKNLMRWTILIVIFLIILLIMGLLIDLIMGEGYKIRETSQILGILLLAIPIILTQQFNKFLKIKTKFFSQK